MCKVDNVLDGHLSTASACLRLAQFDQHSDCLGECLVSPLYLNAAPCLHYGGLGVCCIRRIIPCYIGTFRQRDIP